MPPMSAYKSGSGDLKRKYIKTSKGVGDVESDDDDDADVGDRSASVSDFEDEEPDVKRSETRFRPIEEFGDERPNLSYSCLIALAIQNSPEQRLTLGQIYTAIMDMFPYYKKIDKAGWQNSIRHNLSLNKAFVRKGDSGSSGRSGAFWTIDPVLSIGSFKKIRRFTPVSSVSTTSTSSTPGRTKQISEKLNQVSTQTNESFWEPDPDTFEDSQASSVDTKASSSAKLSSAAQSTSASANVDRRQSIEEFLQLGLGKTPEKRKVKILSSLDIPTVTSSTSAPSSSTLQPSAASSSSELDEAHRQPFMGSIDFYEQYDPDVARDIGQALITTEKLPIEWLCFLCGSAGREEMVFCRSCCEPFHPFCLVRQFAS